MLRYVTTNQGKVREAREYLEGITEVSAAEYDYLEIQSTDLEAIAIAGARDAYRALGAPVLVDDAGLFLSAFDGFPGPYSAFVEDTLGVERVGRLVDDVDDERASFRCSIAYAGPQRDAIDAETLPSDPEVIETFSGSVRGRIVDPRGDGGFGYDPIFEHDGTTFAEMSTAEKNALSHRGRALGAFAEWLAATDA